MHIDDVAGAVILSLDLLSRRQLDRQLVLTLDSAYEYTDADLDHWDAEGPGSTFRKYYPEYYDLALSYGLDPALKPTKLDISETVRWLGYKPAYSLANLLSELAAFGDSPLHLELIQGGGCASRVTLRCRLQQEGSAYNGHFGCTCYHPLFAAADVYGNLVAHRPATGAARSGVTAAVSDETDDEGRGVAGMKQSH